MGSLPLAVFSVGVPIAGNFLHDERRAGFFSLAQAFTPCRYPQFCPVGTCDNSPAIYHWG
jgi:hypothetical protein